MHALGYYFVEYTFDWCGGMCAVWFPRELEQVAVRSLELAERRRSESEDKAAAASTRLREREAEVRTVAFSIFDPLTHD